jgi:hypothetical protein
MLKGMFAPMLVPGMRTTVGFETRRAARLSAICATPSLCSAKSLCALKSLIVGRCWMKI